MERERLGVQTVRRGPQDVRMLRVGGCLDLSPEPLGADHPGELRLQHLDRNLAVVRQILGQLDPAIPPAPSSRSRGLRSASTRASGQAGYLTPPAAAASPRMSRKWSIGPAPSTGARRATPATPSVNASETHRANRWLGQDRELAAETPPSRAREGRLGVHLRDGRLQSGADTDADAAGRGRLTMRPRPLASTPGGSDCSASRGAGVLVIASQIPPISALC